MKNLEEQSGSGRGAESLPRADLDGEIWVDAAQIVRAAIKRYAEAGNGLYERYQQLRLDEFASERRFSSEQVRCAALDDLRQLHYERPLDVLREEYVSELMPLVEEVFRRQLEDISFPSE